ncbi:MAG: tyrosine-type recombinase/integrase [Deltaproteobacteria bacterium]|nr:tyrosine-type recombinase/integrase [Deltaproteobacteria bacterium]
MYDLRHYCATKLIQSGTDMKVAAELTGHANPTQPDNNNVNVSPH